MFLILLRLLITPLAITLQYVFSLTDVTFYCYLFRNGNCCIRQDRTGFGHICAFIYSDNLVIIR